MPNVKVVHLKVQSARSSEHAFNNSGIIEYANADRSGLGARVAAYDVRTAIYPSLSSREVVDGKETGLLIFNSAKLRAELTPFATHVLSNEVLAAELDQQILRRQNEFLTRHVFADEAEATIKKTVPERLASLARLRQSVEQHFLALDQAYGEGAVKAPKVTMATRLAGLSTVQTSTARTFDGDDEKQRHEQVATSSVARWDGKAWQVATQPEALLLSQETVSVADNDELRHPKLENAIRHARAQADLLEELLQATLANSGVTHLRSVWSNQLDEIDLDIRKSQIRYIDSFLLPRVQGVVTGLYKQPGENVRSGETVMKVEDDSSVYLTGQVRTPHEVQLSQGCSVTVANAFVATDGATDVKLAGRVVSVRGCDNEPDRWNVVMHCNYLTERRLPLGYGFEPAVETVVVAFG